MVQTTSNTPMARVRAAFGSKADLIAKVKGLATPEIWSDRLNSDKSWAGLSNRQLLRLHAVLNEVRERFGSREKLVDALVGALGRQKDGDFKKHFTEWPLPRLLDSLKSTKKAESAKEDKPAPAKAAPAAKPAPAAGAAKPAETTVTKAAAKDVPAKKPAASAAAATEAAPAKKAPAAAKSKAAEGDAPAKKPAAKKGAKKAE